VAKVENNVSKDTKPAFSRGPGYQLGNYNVFVGPNATGKTNFIRILKLISNKNSDQSSLLNRKVGSK
jgi:predicted ATPase